MIWALIACSPSLSDKGSADSASPPELDDTALPTETRDAIAVAFESPADGDTFWEAQAPYLVVRVASEGHDDLTALHLAWTGAAASYDDAPTELDAKGTASFLLPDLAVGPHTAGLEVSDGSGRRGSDDVSFEVLERDVDGDGHVDDNFGGDDCDDDDPKVYAGAEELCDGVDNDCDKEIDEGC